MRDGRQRIRRLVATASGAASRPQLQDRAYQQRYGQSTCTAWRRKVTGASPSGNAVLRARSVDRGQVVFFTTNGHLRKKACCRGWWPSQIVPGRTVCQFLGIWEASPKMLRDREEVSVPLPAASLRSQHRHSFYETSTAASRRPRNPPLCTRPYSGSSGAPALGLRARGFVTFGGFGGSLPTRRASTVVTNRVP